jgi:hypothetical protein
VWYFRILQSGIRELAIQRSRIFLKALLSGFSSADSPQRLGLTGFFWFSFVKIVQKKDEPNLARGYIGKKKKLASCFVLATSTDWVSKYGDF